MTVDRISNSRKKTENHQVCTKKKKKENRVRRKISRALGTCGTITKYYYHQKKRK